MIAGFGFYITNLDSSRSNDIPNFEYDTSYFGQISG